MALRRFSTKSKVADYLKRKIDISDEKARLALIKHPALGNLTIQHISDVFKLTEDFQLSKVELLQHPSLITALPVTIEHRMKVLKECGFKSVTIDILAKFLSLVRGFTISELIDCDYIDGRTNISERLCAFINGCSLEKVQNDGEPFLNCTLDDLRSRVLKEYLNMIFGMTEKEYDQMRKTYTPIRHKPFQTINRTIEILTNDLKFDEDRIKTNLFLLNCNPQNLKLIMKNIKTIAGVDIQTIFHKRTSLCRSPYVNFIEIQNILKKYNISIEAQRKCFEIYTLSPKTVEKRLSECSKSRTTNVYMNNPRILRIIFYEKQVKTRLNLLNNQTTSLNLLLENKQHFDAQLKTGERFFKGTDVLTSLEKTLGSRFSPHIKRHPFWLKVSLMSITENMKKLLKNFAPNEIGENIQIVLYPWDNIEDCIEKISKNNGYKLSNSQILSLTLYFLGKEHNFTGNGVWDPENLLKSF